MLSERPTRYVLFVHAPWSAPSIVALKALVRRHESSSGPILVVHVDDVASEPLLEGRRFHGWGETFWVENGEVVREDLGIRRRSPM